MRVHGRVRAACLVASQVLALGVVLSACGGSDQPSAASSSSASGTATSSASTSGTPSSTPTTPSEPADSSSAAASGSSLAAASGDPVTLATMSFRFPAGWQVSQAVSRTNTAAFDPSTAHGSVIVYDQPSFGGETVESEAKLSMGTAERNGMHPVRQPDITVNGVEGYVITGADPTYPVYYVFGTVDHGHDVTMIFQYSRNTAKAQPTIASVLASVVWT